MIDRRSSGVPRNGGCRFTSGAAYPWARAVRASRAASRAASTSGYAPGVKTLTVALAQLAPSLGMFDANLARHHELIEEARGRGAGLVVFPELGLTGYLLQDLAAEVAIRLDDPRLAGLAAASEGLSIVVSFVEESADHRLFIAAALLEDGRIRHVHRKLFLPTYGLFDERRFFAAGDLLRATPSQLGVGVGIAICEDFWHLTVPQVLALDGAQILINVSSSPGRDLAATNEVGLVTVEVPLADLRRERLTLPLLRDEQPELQVRELTRIVAERAGLAPDSTADELAEAGLDVAPGDPVRVPIGFRPKAVP